MSALKFIFYLGKIKLNFDLISNLLSWHCSINSKSKQVLTCQYFGSSRVLNRFESALKTCRSSTSLPPLPLYLSDPPHHPDLLASTSSLLLRSTSLLISFFFHPTVSPSCLLWLWGEMTSLCLCYVYIFSFFLIIIPVLSSKTSRNCSSIEFHGIDLCWGDWITCKG